MTRREKNLEKVLEVVLYIRDLTVSYDVITKSLMAIDLCLTFILYIERLAGIMLHILESTCCCLQNRYHLLQKNRGRENNSLTWVTRV